MTSTTGVMRIGEVHALLRKDFPDVELSKIRYYEDKGLVEPSRSRKGYRLYSERDVACLHEAIRLAQEEFVPLRVVRLRLIEQGLLSVPNVTSSARHAARESTISAVSAPAPTRPALSVVVSNDVVEELPVKRYFSSADLLAATGLAPESFNTLQSLGLVSPLNVDGETVYDALDVRVAAHARALLERGVDTRLLGSLRRVAEREVGVVSDMVAQLPTGRGREEVRVTLLGDVAKEVAALQHVLFERELAALTRD